MLLPTGSVLQGVHVCYESNTWDVTSRNALGGNHGELPTLEHHSAVWNTGVIQKTCDKVDTSAKVLWRGGSKLEVGVLVIGSLRLIYLSDLRLKELTRILL